MNIPANLMYAKSHEWVEFLTETTCRVCISDYAQHAMGDIVFVNLPAAGDEATAGEALATLNRSGGGRRVQPGQRQIAEVNGELDDQPECQPRAPMAPGSRDHNVTGRDG